MPVIKITKADIEKVKTLEPGWYGSVISKVSDPTPAKDKQSVNTVLTFVIDKVGKEIPVYINSKLIAMIIPVYEAVTGKKYNEEFDLDTDTLIGKKLDVKLGTTIYNGNPQNQIEGYLPYGQGANQKAPF
jgi:hypothetical protein